MSFLAGPDVVEGGNNVLPDVLTSQPELFIPQPELLTSNVDVIELPPTASNQEDVLHNQVSVTDVLFVLNVFSSIYGYLFPKLIACVVGGKTFSATLLRVKQ